MHVDLARATSSDFKVPSTVKLVADLITYLDNDSDGSSDSMHRG